MLFCDQFPILNRKVFLMYVSFPALDSNLTWEGVSVTLAQRAGACS
jgi:hypothetical protein